MDDKPVLGTAMFDLTEAFIGPIQSAALGYRAQLLAEDTPIDIANQMMCDMHHLLCRTVGGEIEKQEDGDKEAELLATVMLRLGFKPLHGEASVDGIREWAQERIDAGWTPDDGWEVGDGTP